MERGKPGLTVYTFEMPRNSDRTMDYLWEDPDYDDADTRRYCDESPNHLHSPDETA